MKSSLTFSQNCQTIFENSIPVAFLSNKTENPITSSFIFGENLTLIGLCGLGEEAFLVKIETENVLKSSEDEIEVPS